MDSKLIDKYFKGECSPQEVQQVLKWFNSQEMGGMQEHDMDQFWQETETEKAEEEFAPHAARLLATINKKIETLEKQSINSAVDTKARQTQNDTKSRWKVILKAAASVLLPMGFLWVLAGYLSSENKPVKVLTIETLPGTRKTIQLEDGSKIQLNGASKVSYQEHFSSTRREITLRGEAFFEVAKDSLRPFIVRTGTLSTQALGTSFNIEYRAKENAISVALATGIVKIEKENQKTASQVARLKPGQQLVYNKVNHGYQVKQFDAMEVLSWREGVLYFKKANLAQVVSKLENWYGVTIGLTGKIPIKENEWHYTGSYQNQSLDNVLEGMAFVKKFSYEKKGNTIKITFN